MDFGQEVSLRCRKLVELPAAFFKIVLSCAESQELLSTESSIPTEAGKVKWGMMTFVMLGEHLLQPPPLTKALSCSGNPKEHPAY